MKKSFEEQREALLSEIRSVLEEAETLYQDGVEAGAEEAADLRAKLADKLEAAKGRLVDFEAKAGCKVKETAKQADQLVQDKPYYAMGFAALAGLVVGVLLNRR